MKGKKLINYSILFVSAFILCVSGFIKISAAGIKYEDEISVKYYIMLLEQELKLPSSKPVESAMQYGLVRNEDNLEYEKALSNEEAAILINRADIILKGENQYDQKKYETMKAWKRISDIKSIQNSNREDAYQAFVKGLMTGYSKGKCTQYRDFKGTQPIKRKDAIEIVKRLTKEELRKKISPDGQVIRTINLPKNYKKYKYILESFPNSFYEFKFRNEYTTYSYTPKELINYACPAKMDQMADHFVELRKRCDWMWRSKVVTNLTCRLNADYRTIDNKWINELRQTYFMWDPEYDQKQTKEIKKYVEVMKKNKVVVKAAQITVEPSTWYWATGHYIRVYVKFKITADNINVDHHDLIYTNSHLTWIKNLKNGVWVEGYYDLSVATSNGYSTGEDYAVFMDRLNDYYYKGRERGEK